MSRPRVAYLACPTTMPGSPLRREDAFEHDLMMGLLGRGLHFAGRTLEAVSWDDSSIDWSEFEAAIIGTTWDYAQRMDAFEKALADIAAKTRLMNPASLVHWNARKTYLRDMADRGCATIPTLWPDGIDEAICRAAFDQFGVDAIVIKPQVGAGAWRQVLLQRGDPWPHTKDLPEGPAMVQPFMPSIKTEGEYSFLFFDRQFSHAVVKRAAPTDYRIQSSYGGTDVAYVPTPAELACASAAIACVKGDLLTARVDMVRGPDGTLLLIELELIEPYLYPLFAPEMGARFSAAYVALIARTIQITTQLP
jgi:hypothetical protein